MFVGVKFFTNGVDLDESVPREHFLQLGFGHDEPFVQTFQVSVAGGQCIGGHAFRGPRQNVRHLSRLTIGNE